MMMFILKLVPKVSLQSLTAKEYQSQQIFQDMILVYFIGESTFQDLTILLQVCI